MENITFNKIVNDHKRAILTLTKEENRIALECARKVRAHLEKATAGTPGKRYMNNLRIVEAIIHNHQEALKDPHLQLYDNDGKLGLAS